MKRAYACLQDYCEDNNNSDAKRLLQQTPDLDLLHADGLYFKLAVKHQNLEMLNILLEYYTKTKLSDDNHDALPYKIANYNLRMVLQEAERKFEVTDAMQKVLGPYIATVEDEHDQDLGELDENEEAAPPVDTSHSSISTTSACDKSFSSSSSTSLAADPLHRVDHMNNVLSDSTPTSSLPGSINSDNSAASLLGTSAFE